MIGKRTRAREIALQALFCQDLQRDAPLDATEVTLHEAEASEEIKSFARELINGVLLRLAHIDGLIASAAENWDVNRLAVVDRNILRLAVHELLDREDIPTKVSINEAIELGKRYSTAQSGGFINGILDRIRKDLGLVVSMDDEPVAAGPPEPEVRPLVVGEAAAAAPSVADVEAEDG